MCSSPASARDDERPKPSVPYDPPVTVGAEDPSHAQARSLIADLERVTDRIVAELESTSMHPSSANRRRSELYEARALIRLLETQYGLSTITARRDAAEPSPDLP